MDSKWADLTTASNQSNNDEGEPWSVVVRSRVKKREDSKLVAGTSSLYRQLAEHGNLGAVIFGCTDSSFTESIDNQLFCTSNFHWTYVKHIEPGMPLFLFNYFSRTLFGVFEAVTYSELNYTSTAMIQEGSSGLGYTKYPAQVPVQLKRGFSNVISLNESVYKKILVDNYWSTKYIHFELDICQTRKLIKAFLSKARSHVIENCIASSQVEKSFKIFPVHKSSRTTSTMNLMIPKQDMRFENNVKVVESSLAMPQCPSPLLAGSQMFAYQNLIPHDTHYSEKARDAHINWRDLHEDETYPNAKIIIASLLSMIDDDYPY